ncbi:MAG: hypothetical protein FWD57_10025, partial [Polyangiaceae bacterium]|nr:hypothetical protein [Polyangiaceae bacterium]
MVRAKDVSPLPYLRTSARQCTLLRVTAQQCMLMGEAQIGDNGGNNGGKVVSGKVVSGKGERCFALTK